MGYVALPTNVIIESMPIGNIKAHLYRKDTGFTGT